MPITLQNYMRSLVTVEDDPTTSQREGYFLANSKDELVNAFSDIFDQISNNTPSFSTPSYSLSTAQGGMSHDGNLYIPLAVKSEKVDFQPRV